MKYKAGARIHKHLSHLSKSLVVIGNMGDVFEKMERGAIHLQKQVANAQSGGWQKLE